MGDLAKIEQTIDRIMDRSEKGWKFGVKPHYGGSLGAIFISADRQTVDTIGGTESFRHWVSNDFFGDAQTITQAIGGSIRIYGEWSDPATSEHDGIASFTTPLFFVHTVRIDDVHIVKPDVIESIIPDHDQILAVDWVFEPSHFETRQSFEDMLAIWQTDIFLPPQERKLKTDMLSIAFGIEDAITRGVVLPQPNVNNDILPSLRLWIEQDGEDLIHAG